MNTLALVWIAIMLEVAAVCVAWRLGYEHGYTSAFNEILGRRS